MINWADIKQQLISFLQNEVKNAGFKKVTVGLSGGLDSAVVALLCKEAFGTDLNSVLMPSQFSSGSSVQDAIELCEEFDIRYDIVSIEPLVKAYLEDMENDKLRIGNFSARMRMSILYDISSKENSLVVGTSNRSEILLGYGTIYGDTACAINPIGNIYKSDEYEFAKYLGVSQAILDKKPSADLWEGQSDEDDIGYSYSNIDALLKKMVDEKKCNEELLKLGFSQKMIEDISNRIRKNAFKTKMPKIATINKKS